MTTLRIASFSASLLLLLGATERKNGTFYISELCIMFPFSADPET